jgi:hypothetical protein
MTTDAAPSRRYGGNGRLDDAYVSLPSEDGRIDANSLAATFPKSDGVLTVDADVNGAQRHVNGEEEEAYDSMPVFGDAVWKTDSNEVPGAGLSAGQNVKGTYTMERTLDLLYGDGDSNDKYLGDDDDQKNDVSAVRDTIAAGGDGGKLGFVAGKTKKVKVSDCMAVSVSVIVRVSMCVCVCGSSIVHTYMNNMYVYVYVCARVYAYDMCICVCKYIYI